MTNEFIANDVSASPTAGTPPVSGETSSSSSVAPTSDLRTLRQDQIDNIVRDAHHRGYAKRDKELAANTQPVQQPQTVNNPGYKSPEEIQKMVEEAAARAVQQSQLQQSADLLVNQFQQKMQQGAAKYPDFAQKVNNLDFSRMVDLVQMSTGLDNTADVMYDLASNPYKIANLQQLAQLQPQLAIMEMQKLSQSIKANQAPPPSLGNPPLGQITNSPIGTSNDSMPDVDYFKNRYRG